MNGWLVGTGAALATTTVVSGALMARPIRTMKRANGIGIVPFELAGTDRRGRAILVGWGVEGVAAAKRSLHLDFPFLVGYAGLGALLAAATADPAGEAARPSLTSVGWAMAGGAVLAGVADAVENVALLRAISAWRDGESSLERPMRLARRAAITKFALVYLVAGWLLLLVTPSLVLDRLELL